MKIKFAFALAFVLSFSSGASFAQQVEIKTNQGSITVELYGDKAPVTVTNFLQYAKDGFYSGTVFHRVIDGFMIQGGGFAPDMREKRTRAPIKNEADLGIKAGLRNTTGTLAMARTPDPDSASAQFFINLKDNDFLNHSAPTQSGWGYAVFGKVTKGMDVVQKIAKVDTASAGPHQNVPRTPVIIESVQILPAK
jgi:cyclophilin family peptidyl-prolyl cis-trans isomerase